MTLDPNEQLAESRADQEAAISRDAREMAVKYLRTMAMMPAKLGVTGPVGQEFVRIVQSELNDAADRIEADPQ